MSRGLAVIAFGGNALVRDADHQSIPDQYVTVTETAAAIVDMIEAGWRVVVTHGNGPQVGYILRRSELALHEVAAVPLDYAVGDTQGAIGYMFSKALHNELLRRDMPRPVVSVVTQTVVNPDDPAFSRPTKPVGGFMDEAVARRYQQELGWTVAAETGRGWRRTVPSPVPEEIVELEVIRELSEAGNVVVACGGGGIPVARDADGQLVGVEAVIDKDRASSLLAAELGADLLVIPTGVERVAIRFGTPEQQWLDVLSPAEAARYAAEGHFGEGSMQPKVEAVLGFLRARPAAAGLITAPPSLAAALDRRSGTWIENAPTGSPTTKDSAMTETTQLAVNGTLMRDLELNSNLTDTGATFARDDETAPCYRLWSIDDRHPAMIRTTGDAGVSVHLEVWDIPLQGLASVLSKEPAGLAVGKVLLADGTVVLGVLGEPFLVEGQREITEFGGWRAYTRSSNGKG